MWITVFWIVLLSYAKDNNHILHTMKTIEERVKEMVTIRKKLKNIGISAESVPSIQPIFDRMNDFLKEDITWSGGAYLPEIERFIDVKLSNRHPCDVTLRVPSTSKKASRRP